MTGFAGTGLGMPSMSLLDTMLSVSVLLNSIVCIAGVLRTGSQNSESLKGGR